MARWFFGPPLFDRVFVHTGGSCLADPPRSPAALGLPVATLQACKQAGGSWSGGHDVSGHCFLLIHSTLFLVDEVLAPLRAAGRRSASPAAAQRAVLAAALGLVAVWVFMLFVTARYFHGAPELLSGIAAGAGGWVAQRAATASLLS
ncbi:hypothetical protein LPJ61_002155 [Coemansia biformis]|uniref:Uncharacterized protein n=1 Tax=Coemansia biformis TaxID=1286918 RepID=A0A9W7YEL9_9FUNG|nr:hypothetical protein LPJ61_002155 [Coemansia biformis]